MNNNETSFLRTLNRLVPDIRLDDALYLVSQARITFHGPEVVMSDEAVDCLRRGSIIAAIKHVRDDNRHLPEFSLRDAKEFVEAYRDRHGFPKHGFPGA